MTKKARKKREDLPQWVKNIKFLRAKNDETQEVLKDILNVPQSTISSYETGACPIPRERLEILAYHYRVSVYDLMYTDLSKYEGILDVPSKEILFKCLNLLFPFIKSNDAMDNEFFRKGYESVNEMKQQAMCGKKIDFDKLVDCLVSFRVAWEQSNLCVAIVNYISIIYFICSCFAFESNDKLLEFILKEEAMTPLDKQQYYLRNAPNWVLMEKRKQDRIEFVNDNKQTVMEYIRILKEKQEYRDLADYLIAIKYIVGFTDNQFDMSINQNFAEELIQILCFMENQYALNLLNAFE